MNREEMDAAIQAFLDNGGEVTYLRYSDKKTSDKARRMAYHRDKASAGNERSKAIIAREEAKEATMIFSRIERNKEG
jgi:hypothetical protein